MEAVNTWDLHADPPAAGPDTGLRGQDFLVQGHIPDTLLTLLLSFLGHFRGVQISHVLAWFDVAPWWHTGCVCGLDWLRGEAAWVAHPVRRCLVAPCLGANLVTCFRSFPQVSVPQRG